MMKRTAILLATLIFSLALATTHAGELWRIGEFDGKCGEFALEPGKAPETWAEDGTFCPGLIAPKTGWPYAQPGPADAWAGDCSHAFDIVFGVAKVPADGDCTLKIGVLDHQPDVPPTLRIEINGQNFTHAFPRATGPGLGIRNNFAQAHPSTVAIKFPVTLLKPGVNTIRIITTAGSWFVYDAVALEAPAGTEAQEVTDDQLRTTRSGLAKVAMAQRRLDRIVIVYKTHFDIGYSDLASNVVAHYRTGMIDHALAVVDQYKDVPKEQQFVWTVPGWPLEQMLWDGQDPQRKARIEQAVRSGNLVFHSLPFTVETESMEPEDFVRGLGHSSRLARRFGLPLPRGAKMTDVPSHTWIVPTILRHAGIDFLHIGANDATHPPKVPLLFWWEGPDGSRLMTLLANTYGTWPDPPKDWPYRTWLALLHTGDNQGPPAPQTVKNNLGYYAKKYPGAKVTVGQLEDFYDALMTEKPDLPVVRGDMPDCWIHGYASSPEGVKEVTTLRPEIAAAEMLGTLGAAWGLKLDDASAAVASAYEKSLQWSEHTWGLANQHHVHLKYEKKPEEGITVAIPQNNGYQGRKDPNGIANMEASWQEHIQYPRDGRQVIEPVLDAQMQALAAAVNVPGKRIVVFNSLPWTRDDVVRVTVDGEDRTFIAKDIPPCGYRTYPVGGPRSVVAAAGTTIECPFFKVTFDPARGRIASLIDKKTGRELVDADAPEGFGYFYERFSNKEATAYSNAYAWPWFHGSHGFMMSRAGTPADQPYRSYTPTNLTFRAQVTPTGVTGTLSGPPSLAMPHGIRISLTLYNDLPVADLEVEIEKPSDAWPEACYVALPFKFDKPQFRVGRTGSVIDPAQDIIEAGSQYYYWTDTGVAISDDRSGVGICAIESPLVSLGQPGIMRFADRYVPDKSHVYFNMFNNIWFTNFVGWYGGNILTHLRLWTFDKFDPATALVIPGMNAKRPLLAAVADGPTGKLPASQAGLTLSRPGVLVTAFGANPDGPGTVLRLWEQGGQSGECRVRLPAGMKVKSAQPVDLRGQPIAPAIALTGNEFTLELRAYAPYTVMLK